MALPCFNEFEKMEEAIKAYEDCYDAIDEEQDLITIGGAGAVLTCSFAVVAPSVESGAACAVVGTGYWLGFRSWLKKIDKCNDLVFDALKLGKDFEKCSAVHKDVLNAAAAANS